MNLRVGVGRLGRGCGVAEIVLLDGLAFVKNKQHCIQEALAGRRLLHSSSTFEVESGADCSIPQVSVLLCCVLTESFFNI